MPRIVIISPRVWAGMPYKSKQLKFAPDLAVTNTRPFNVVSKDSGLCFKIGDNCLQHADIEAVAANDELSVEDFVN